MPLSVHDWEISNHILILYIYKYINVHINTFIHFKFIFIPREDLFLYLVNAVFTKTHLELNEKNIMSVFLFAFPLEEHNWFQ